MAIFIPIILVVLPAIAMADTCFPGPDMTVHAECDLKPDCRNSLKTDIKGKVHIYQRKSETFTYFKVMISGLPPNTAHGFHIHTSGDIVSEGCTSAGGHYNPFHKQHGGQTDTNRHAGDLGNVFSDQNGEVVVMKRSDLASLIGTNSIIGRSFVLHAKKDDLGRGGNVESKITGNAGARIACGVILPAQKNF